MTFKFRASNFTDMPKLYLAKGTCFEIWMDSGRVMRRMKLEDALKQGYVFYEESRQAFGGEEYAAVLIIRNSKVRITIK
jgi:hypothetical protein